MIKDITLKGCLEFAVATEELGAKTYDKLAAKFTSVKELSEIFSRLSADEQIHKRTFSELLKQIPQGDEPSGAFEKLEYLRAMSASEFFSNGPFQRIDQIQDRDSALQIAFEFEKATLGFYKAVEDVLGKQDVLNQVIEMERNHIVILMKALLVEGSAFRSLQDIWP